MVYRSASAYVLHFLSEVDLFRGLSERHLERIAALCEDFAFEAGDYLGFQDAPGDRLYLVVSGEITATTGPSDSPLEVRTVVAHEAFPVAALFNPPVLVTTSRAASDGTAFAIRRVRLLELCEIEPRIGMRVFSNASAILASRYRRALDMLAAAVGGEG